MVVQIESLTKTNNVEMWVCKQAQSEVRNLLRQTCLIRKKEVLQSVLSDGCYFFFSSPQLELYNTSGRDRHLQQTHDVHTEIDMSVQH